MLLLKSKSERSTIIQYHPISVTVIHYHLRILLSEPALSFTNPTGCNSIVIYLAKLCVPELLFTKLTGCASIFIDRNDFRDACRYRKVRLTQNLRYCVVQSVKFTVDIDFSYIVINLSAWLPLGKEWLQVKSSTLVEEWYMWCVLVQFRELGSRGWLHTLAVPALLGYTKITSLLPPYLFFVWCSHGHWERENK